MYFKVPFIILLFFAGLVAWLTFRTPSEESMAITGNDPLSAAVPKSASDSNAVAESTVSPAHESLSVAGIEVTDLRAHVEFLADDLLEGRETGSRGARLASIYIANQFARFGLLTIGHDEGYFQKVPLYEKTISDSTEVMIEVDGELISLQYVKDFLILNTPSESGTVVETQLVFTGFGIEAPEYSYNDFEGLNLEDKVTVYVSGEPTSEDPDFFEGQAETRYGRGGVKRATAYRIGAKGVVGVIRPSQFERLNWQSRAAYYTRPKTSLAGLDDTSESPFPAIVFTPDVGELLFSGTGQRFAEIDKLADEGRISSFEMNKAIRIKVIFDYREIEGRNVAGFLQGSDPELKSEVIVYTAHYDHVGIGTPVAGDSIYNGAADNASGVAGLLELAEAFSHLPKPPRRSILFLALCAEEKGLLGSEYYIQNPIFPLSKTVANLNLDMIGVGDSTSIVVYGIERSSLGGDIRRAAQRVGLRIKPDEMPEEKIFYRSDHYNFARVGIPAIYPSFGIDRAGYEEYISYYHKPNDDKHLKFSYNYMAKHVAVAFITGLMVADSDTRPVWTPGDEFENARK